MLIQERIDNLRESIKHLEMCRIALYKQLAEEYHFDESSDIRFYDRLPKVQVERINLGETVIYRFCYDGLLPLYDREQKYRQELRNYYIDATWQAYDWTKVTDRFDYAFVAIIHSFENLKIRDLDNRNRKLLLDALRKTLLIKDDSWQKITYYEKGIKSDDYNVKMYVGDELFYDKIILFALQDAHSVKT